MADMHLGHGLADFNYSPKSIRSESLVILCLSFLGRGRPRVLACTSAAHAQLHLPVSGSFAPVPFGDGGEVLAPGQVLLFMSTALLNQTSGPQGYCGVSCGILAGNDLGTGSGWQQSRPNRTPLCSDEILSSNDTAAPLSRLCGVQLRLLPCVAWIDMCSTTVLLMS